MQEPICALSHTVTAAKYISQAILVKNGAPDHVKNRHSITPVDTSL